MKTQIVQSPYEFFSLGPEATEKEIKDRYISMVKEYSPEKDPDMFMKIREAYNIITKPDMNTAYCVFFRDPVKSFTDDETEEEKTPASEFLKKYFETPFNSDYELKNTFVPIVFNIK
ncbi:MAG: J domain-containing protein [Bacteroidia bacterium]|nr:J domain-containing protein [Bacteroidia bacterium]